MREHVSQSKKATTASFSIPSLKHRIPGFGSDSSQASPQAVPLVQPLHKPLTHDISRIPLRNPQAKLSISQPGDKYEQEADSVAQQVMQRIAQPVNRQSIQPEAMPEGEELQMKPLANSIRPLQRQEMPEDEEELQMKSLDNSTLQRQEVPEEEEELQMKSMVQRQASMAAAPDLETSINQARGGGQTMADNIRHPMEVAFGTDFSGVKVHTDSQSDQLNRSIQARAFTTGQDVFFRQGEYNPGSRGGQELLAHELTHVVQQNGGAVHSTVDDRLKGGEDHSQIQPQSNVTQPIKATGGIVQRLSYAIKHPNENKESYDDILADATKGGDFPVVKEANEFKKVNDQGRTVNIYAHGNQADVGGMNPIQLASHLKKDCGMLATVRSVILHSCMSAVPDPREKEASFGMTYAEQLHEELLKLHDHHAEVTGQEGLAFTDSKGHTRVLKEGKQENDYKHARDKARAKNNEQEVQQVEDEYLKEATVTYTKLKERLTSEEIKNNLGDINVLLRIIRNDPQDMEERSQKIEENERWKAQQTEEEYDKVRYTGYQR